MTPLPSFMIVGTGRSGTTLVQRLVCELPGVRVPPETQFFWSLAPRLTNKGGLPLGETKLIHDLQWFISRRGLDTGRFRAQDIVDELGGRCDHLLDLFGTIVRRMAGEAAVYGEKTPQHLYWWKELSTSVPQLKFVAVVRDPRAVVASKLQVHWTTKSHVLLAERWRFDHGQVMRAVRELGPERCLVLRYEDVVADAALTRNRLAEFLGLAELIADSYEPYRVQASEIMQPDESWKSNAVETVTQDRISAWRETLTPRQIAEVSAICRSGMRHFGYGEDAPGLLSTTRRSIGFGLTTNIQRLRYRASRRLHLLRVHRMAAYL